MTGPEQPERLKVSSAQSPALRSLLRTAEHDGATDDQVARLKARLPPGTAGGSGHGGHSGSPIAKATAASSLPWKAIAAVVVAGALAGGGWVRLSRHHLSDQPADSPLVSASAVNASAPTQVSEPAESLAACKVQPSTSATVVSAPTRSTGTGGPISSAPSRPSETALLDEARRVVSDHPGRALALLRQHRQLYPDGMLAQEREVLMVDALNKLGRSSEAQQQADRFRNAHPGSVYGDRLEKTVQPASPVDSSGAP